ncbi:VRR-NUC domain-containing protein [Trueperella pyogenes]|uniref:VRR-NUC domain-containing protein n=1 Tax=Trueperella pyogenes TaxID=1661 RepID=UPI0014333CBA|nr:VRR-NUC domain-containing protein [Trueperella pyogenes]QIU87384.1 VRR-NUC domain-containing protein [Trueperella pyogenes]
MKEQKLERRLVDAITAQGGLCWKFTSPGTAGVPDRICVLDGHIVFVELKAPGRTPRPIQIRRIRQLQNHKIPVLVIDNQDGIKEVLHALHAA